MTQNTEDALRNVRLGYIAKFPSRIEEIKSLADETTLSPDQDRVTGAIARLSAVSHRLAGSGATFGFPQVSEKARQLEALCEKHLEGGPQVLAALFEGVNSLTEAMTQAAGAGAGGDWPNSESSPPVSLSAAYRVLVVDDEESIAAYNKAVLESAGMEVRTETNPDRVLEVLAAFRPQLILLDLQMPGISGQELAAIIGGQESLRRIPIVFLSGEEDLSKRQQVTGLGERFLPKPVDRNTLIDAVSEAIEKSTLTGC